MCIAHAEGPDLCFFAFGVTVFLPLPLRTDPHTAKLTRTSARHHLHAWNSAHIEDMYAKNITKAFQKHFVTDMQALGYVNACPYL